MRKGDMMIPECQVASNRLERRIQNKKLCPLTYLFSFMAWSPFATVDDVGEFSIGIPGNGTCAFTDQVDHFLDMKLQVLKSYN